MATVRLSPWILGMAFLGLPRLAQAQNVTSGTAVYTTNWTGGTIDSGATLRLDNGGTVSGDVTNNGTLQYNGTGPLTISNTVTGSGTLSLTGSGILTLSGANTYTGLTTVSTGALNIRNANALGTTAAGTSVTSGAALQIQGGITTGTEALTLNGTGITTTGALRNISDTNTYAGLITLGGASRINSDAGTLTLSNTGKITGSGFGLAVGGAGNTTIAGIDTGSGTLTKDGAGTLTLTQSSGFSGGLAVNEGTVRLLASNFYALNDSGSVSIASGAVLSADQTANNHHHIGMMTLNGGTLTSINGPAGEANDGGYGIFYVKGGVVVGGSSMSTISATTVGLNNGSFNVENVAVGTDLLVSSRIITADGPSLIKTGDGTMTLTGANTYTTATTISAGTLQIGAGGTTGSLSANSAITNNGTLSFNRSNTITQGTDFHREISGTGAVTQAGSGTLVLSGTNTYSGGTTINSGTVRLGSQVNQALGTGTVVVNSGSTLVTDRIALANSLTLNGGTMQETNGFGSTFSGAINLAATSTVTTDTSMALLNTVSGAGGLIKNGAGTVTLSGANTYAAATTINTGTLEVSGASGALTATSAVNINGGTLLLSGSAANRISDAAPISLGAATGSKLQLSGAVTETLGALTLAGGAGARVIDFGATSGVITFDSLSAASNLPLQIWNWSDSTDRLIISSGVLGGFLTASNISFFSDGGSSLIGTAQFSSTQLVPVPEASTLLAVLGLIAPLAWRERRHWMRCHEARG